MMLFLGMACCQCFQQSPYGAMAWQPASPPPPRPPKLSERRHVLNSLIAVAGSVSGFSSFSTCTNAAGATDEFVSYEVSPFSFDLPNSGWKALVKPNNPKGPKMFAALDFNTGAALTVVEEQACSPAQYATTTSGSSSSAQRCDLLLPSGQGELLFSDTSLSKDVSKLLIRYDDRDNVALEGITVLDSVQPIPSGKNTSFDLVATTTIPTGGTYQDTLGLDRPYTILRKVEARVVCLGDRILSLWLSAPVDEWRKPVTGAKLLQILASVQTSEA